MRGLAIVFILLIPLLVGYGLGALRARSSDRTLRERNDYKSTLSTVTSALRVALADPTLSASTTITLDDARLEAERVLSNKERRLT